MQRRGILRYAERKIHKQWKDCIMEEVNYIKMAAYFGAAIAMGIGAIGPALSQGMVAAKSVESMGKYPEMSTKIRMAMLIALGIIETSAIYAFIIALLLVFK